MPRRACAARLIPAGLLAAALTALLPAADAGAGQLFVPTGRNTLRGLPGVEVIVESLQPELEGAGLTQASIRASVLSRLQAAGIRVYGSQAENPSPAKAYLYVHVNGLLLPAQSGYAVAVQVHLRQTLRSLVTESSVVNAMTWDAHDLIAVPAANLARVQREIQGHVDVFARDWVAMHEAGPPR